MQKVSILLEGEESRTCVVSELETPKQILIHFNVNPDTNVIYINGTILSSEKMNRPIGNRGGSMFMVIRSKTN